MRKFTNFFNYVVSRDTVNQYLHLTENTVPTISKVILHISFKPNFFKVGKTLGFCLFVIEYLTNQKAIFSFSARDVAVWRLRKKQLVSVYTTLRGTYASCFFEKLLFAFLVKLKHFEFHALQSNSVVTLNILNFITFSELERESINITKKNSFFKQYNISVIFVFADVQNNTFSPFFLLNQAQFPSNNK